VVFADIGSSVYYVPGILFHDVGRAAAAFVVLTSLGMMLLARKYVEITARYVDGGGVVSAASEAFGPNTGALGGMLICIGYFLTSAISAVSGFEYISSVAPLGPWKTVLTCLALIFLGLLNVVGIKESALFSAALAVLAFGVTLVTGVLAALQATPAMWSAVWNDFASVQGMAPLVFLEGYAGAWLAFSGLESMSQLAPALDSPKQVVGRRAMVAVAATIFISSPALTAFSVAMLDASKTNPNQFISELGFFAGGQTLQRAVVVSASALLLFAANTAVIGCYHVFVALTRERFLPSSLARVGQRFGTPHPAIAFAVSVPILIILFAQGNLALLGHLYAFGILGAFTLSSLSMDVIAVREKRGNGALALGFLTTAAVGVACAAQVIFKAQSALVGGALVACGMGVAMSVRKGWLHGELNIIPFLTADAAEEAAESLPAMRKILSLAEAKDLAAVYPGGLLLPVRGFRPALLDAAVAMAKSRGFTALHLLFVDEIPGLFYPPKVGPSADCIRTLARCAHYVEEHHLAAVPVWRMAHDAGQSLASAAHKLGCKVVMLGASERGVLWTILRGSVLTSLKETLDKSVTLMVAETSLRPGGNEPPTVVPR